MTVIRGRIRRGVVVMDEPVALPDGTPVCISVETRRSAFWRGQSITELATEQGVGPCIDPDELGTDQPEGEGVDAFLDLIRRSRT